MSPQIHANYVARGISRSPAPATGAFVVSNAFRIDARAKARASATRRVATARNRRARDTRAHSRAQVVKRNRHAAVFFFVAPNPPCSALGLRAACLPPIAGSAACSLVLGAPRKWPLRASLRALASRAMGKAGAKRRVVALAKARRVGPHGTPSTCAGESAMGRPAWKRRALALAKARWDDPRGTPSTCAGESATGQPA
jgi:hypothetical protein